MEDDADANHRGGDCGDGDYGTPADCQVGKTLEDIRLELLDIPGLDGVDQGKPKEEQQEQNGKMERSGLLALKEEEIRLITLMKGTDRLNRRFSIRNSRW